MKILGIHDAHDTAACIMVDGVVVAAVGEERFSRLKSDVDYPEKAIDFCLSYAGIKPDELDCVALVGENVSPKYNTVKRTALFSLEDWIKEQTHFWYPKFYEGKDLTEHDYYETFKHDKKFQNIKSNYDIPSLVECLKLNDPKKISSRFNEIRMEKIINHLKVKREKIVFVKHEKAHAYYGYFATPKRLDSLIFTSEASGEYSNGTVSTVRGNEIKEITHTKENHLGHLYKLITLLLGMKPNQHEYKTMGLAPYSNIKELERSYKVFEGFLKIDGLNIKVGRKLKDIYFEFKERFHGHRFDGIAGALQKFSEDIMAAWVEAVINQTEIPNVLFSGGTAQNIKICKVLAEHPKVDYFFTNPISGDGSLAVGATYFIMAAHCREHNIDRAAIKPLENIYLGPEYTRKDINEAIKRNNLADRFELLEE